MKEFLFHFEPKIDPAEDTIGLIVDPVSSVHNWEQGREHTDALAERVRAGGVHGSDLSFGDYVSLARFHPHLLGEIKRGAE